MPISILPHLGNSSLKDSVNNESTTNRYTYGINPLRVIERFRSNFEKPLIKNLFVAQITKAGKKTRAKQGNNNIEDFPGFFREFVLEKQHAQVTPAPEGGGGAKEGQPDEGVYFNLFGKGKRVFEYISRNDVGKGQNCHNEEKSGTEHLFKMPGEPLDFLQLIFLLSFYPETTYVNRLLQLQLFCKDLLQQQGPTFHRQQWF